MKTVFLFLLPVFFILFHFSLIAQEVICSGGDFYSNSYGSFSFTLGEPVIETFTGNENILTQGFQQSQGPVHPIEGPESKILVNADPNPTRDMLKVTLENTEGEDFFYKIFNSQGKLVSTGEFKGQSTDIHCENLYPSLYILKVYSGEKQVKSIKIIIQ
jgi:hypothetical protein